MNPIRNGNITSSQAIKVLANGKTKDSLGKPALTYIKQLNWERRLGRSIANEANTRPLTWGSFCEKRVDSLLGLAYKFQGQDTISHPEIDFWKGSPDAFKFEGDDVIMGDYKCPLTLTSFCGLVEPLYSGNTFEGNEAIGYIRDNHDDGDKYYWQIVSNAILGGLILKKEIRFGELVIYCPYESELIEIQEQVKNLDDAKQYRYKWIAYANEDELPSLKDGGIYKNLNVIRFQIPSEDKELLTKRVLECGKLLNPFPV